MQIWGHRTYMVLVITVQLSNIMAGPTAAYVISRERRAQRYRSIGLEWLSLESELRVLACVHGPGDAPAILNLLEICSGSRGRSPLASYLLHLLQLTRRLTNAMLYHQREDHHYQHDLGNLHVRHINFAADAFADQTGIAIRQVTAISALDTMHRDVCNAAQDVRASLIILPFHRRRRLDGRMGAGNDGIRALNRQILRHSPCTVGILVDRGMPNLLPAGASTAGSTIVSNPSFAGAPALGQALHHVAVAFFGGPDDREAVACGGRLAVHPCVSVTVFRFVAAAGVSTSMREGSCEELSIAVREDEAEADEEFMASFYERFVVTGMVTYMERLVVNGRETVEALGAMEGMYSLYIVGKGRRRGAAKRLTAGMAEWEECAELGPIGDLLASSDFMTAGSILVLQQYQVAQERCSDQPHQGLSFNGDEVIDRK